MTKKLILTVVAVLIGLASQARVRQNFDKDWRFLLGDSVIMSEVDYDDSGWRQLDVPHDWAIEGDFYAGNPSGAGGGALPGGIGWYRKHFFIENGKLKIENSSPENLQSSIINISWSSTVCI